MIGNAHLDPVWLWTKLEGFAEVISTMESAAKRLEEEGDFIFTCSSASYYIFVKENAPVLFKKIKKFVKVGRWIIVGGWWVEPDCNFPSGETYARHALYSQNFYKKEFGRICQTGYCVDSFGHNANIPQLLRLSGMKNYVFMRPGIHENSEIPSLFFWKAPDGSTVLTYRITEQNYNNSGSSLTADLKTNFNNSQKFGHDMMCFYGIGNHGGGPARAQIAEIKNMIAGGANIKFGSVDSFFDDCRQKNCTLTTYEGDLQNHAIGCYSVSGFIKSLQRTAEAELLKAEKLMLAANMLLGTKYNSPYVLLAYKNVLFNTFHDILCGCSIKKGLIDAVDFYHEAIAAAKKIKEKSMIVLSKNIDTMIDGVTLDSKTDWQIWEERNLGVPLIIFNTNSYPVEDFVAVERIFASCVDDNGRPIELQAMQGRCLNGHEDRMTLIKVCVPAFGYITYWLYKDVKLAAPQSEKIVGEYYLENEYIKAVFDTQNGALISLKDKTSSLEFLDGPSLIPKIYPDKSDTWAHEFPVAYDLSVYEEMKFCGISVAENGGVVGCIRIKYIINNSYVYLDYNLFKGEKKLRISAKVNYCEKNTFMRFHLTSAFSSDECRYEIPFGSFVKKSSEREQPALRFAAGQANDGRALTIVTDSKSSFRIKDNDISFVAIRNSVFAHHGGVLLDDSLYDYTDEGVSRFKFEILPFTDGADIIEITKAADLMSGLDYLVDSYHSGTLSRSYSAFDTDSPNVILSAAKRTEKNDGIILRFYEVGLKDCQCVAIFNKIEINLRFRKGEIKSIYLKDDGSYFETDFLEREL